MTTVTVEPDESSENALRRFEKPCEQSVLSSEPGTRQHHDKPSVERKASSTSFSSRRPPVARSERVPSCSLRLVTLT